MITPSRRGLVAGALAVALGLISAAQALGSPSPEADRVTPLPVTAQVTAACPEPSVPHAAHCLALVRATPPNRTRAATAEPAGFGPSDLRSAYALPGPDSSAGRGQTVAIVDAFDAPTAEADLASYRARFGLPPCTSDNGCFRKVDQRGGTDYPTPDAGWAIEVSLDLDMVSATCPACHILLVDADDNSLENLGTGVDRAAQMGANAISNSYGSFEFPEEVIFEQHFDHPGVAVVASSGDFAYGVQYPAASRYVTAVGGTTLARAGNQRGWSERAWDGAGSGCSAYVDKPSWQHDTLCPHRTVADVAAVADPVTGVAVYDTYNAPGWFVVGGTSAASPIVAGVYALAGNAATTRAGSYPYGHRQHLFDVHNWANGFCGDYLCTSVRGYDGPTGLGTPNGTGGF